MTEPKVEAEVEKKEPPRMTGDEINDMARGIVANQYFVATQAPPDMLTSIFMVLGLGGGADLDWDKVGNVVEEMSKANPMAVNGYPTFFSCRIVHIDDWKVVGEKALAIQAAIDAALGGKP